IDGLEELLARQRARAQPGLALNLRPRHVPAIALGLGQHPAPRARDAAELIPHIVPCGADSFTRRNPHSVAVSEPASVSDDEACATALGNIQYLHKLPFILWGCFQFRGPGPVPVRGPIQSWMQPCSLC